MCIEDLIFKQGSLVSSFDVVNPGVLADGLAATRGFNCARPSVVYAASTSVSPSGCAISAIRPRASVASRGISARCSGPEFISFGI